MRILSLEIKNIRGIKNIRLSPNGQNVVVYGPNGTGKSAIVDAIDFLLTGKISRLTGEGSKVLDIKEHGCHVDSRKDLKNTIVTAKVQIEDQEAILERSINKPSSLKVEPKELKEFVEKRLEITELGQHILTRRDILEYITAEAGKRAKKVMSLLDLDNIEVLRSTFVTVKNEAETEDETAKTNLEIAKSNISTLLSIDGFSEQLVIDKVNELRQTLNGPRIASLLVETIKKDLKPYPFGIGGPTLAIGEIESTVKAVRNIFSNVDNIASKEAELKALLSEVQKDKVLKKCVLYKTLIETGIRLIDDSNVCPLCGRKWDGDFSEYLAEKEKETEIAREKQEKINQVASFISLQISLLKNYIATCVNAHNQFGLKTIDNSELDSYLSELSLWQQTMTKPLESLEDGQWPSSNLQNIFSAPLLEAKLLVPLDEALVKIEPKFSLQLLAWDTLTKMEVRLGLYIQAFEQKRKSEVFRKRGDTALDNFEVARNSVLEAIYDAVKADFEKYYKIMHGSDEGQFSSDISHKGAELNFEVEFYQRGKFPPHALHSEGHQDSMGLCLFFALNRYLVKDTIEVIILDDVVMSIDSGHRRGVCELLENFQPGRQFIITTHDAAWAKQLKAQGIVTRENMIHFANWNIETGPIYEIEKDLWIRIDEDLNKDDIPAAAHRLRRNAEHFFDDICDSLGATIRYKGVHQWELGDYAPAAISTYKKYLKKGKNNAQTIDDEAKFKELEELETKSSAIFEKTQIEQWIVNENVHYNKWENFSKEDFIPIVAAYKELFGLFSCTKCGGLIAFSEVRGQNPRANVSCNCGKIFWDVS